MKISINGRQSEYDGTAVLGELLSSLGIDPKQVAVEHNRSIVPRSMIASRVVESGDEFEIIRLVGGG